MDKHGNRLKPHEVLFIAAGGLVADMTREFVEEVAEEIYSPDPKPLPKPKKLTRQQKRFLLKRLLPMGITKEDIDFEPQFDYVELRDIAFMINNHQKDVVTKETLIDILKGDLSVIDVIKEQIDGNETQDTTDSE